MQEGSSAVSPASNRVDAVWDAFLEGSPLGQFQQSTGWGRVKALDGWSVSRVFLDENRKHLGGLQLLWKETRLGRIGYVSKGPVLGNEDAQEVRTILKNLTAKARSLGLRALILQPPDDSVIAEDQLVVHGYSRKPVSSVIRATAIIEVSGGPDSYLARMGRQIKREARQAAKGGLVARMGDRSDLSRFHALMLESCRRQNSEPNPSRAELLEALWDQLSPRVKLISASTEEGVLAALLMVGYGRRLTFWKKGWDSRGTHLHANSFLMIAALEWACGNGYASVDFVGLDPRIAEDLLAGREMSEEQKRGRDMFNLRLGAQPKLLPPARLIVINPVLRRVLNLARRSRAFEKLLMARIG